MVAQRPLRSATGETNSASNRRTSGIRQRTAVGVRESSTAGQQAGGHAVAERNSAVACTDTAGANLRPEEPGRMPTVRSLLPVITSRNPSPSRSRTSIGSGGTPVARRHCGVYFWVIAPNDGAFTLGSYHDQLGIDEFGPRNGDTGVAARDHLPLGHWVCVEWQMRRRRTGSRVDGRGRSAVGAHQSVPGSNDARDQLACNAVERICNRVHQGAPDGRSVDG
jgi:hypothetical protein